MTEGKAIGNVNILDIRATTEDTIAAIRKIGNVNIAIYSPRTASFFSRVDVGNVNVMIEVPEDVNVRRTMGNLRLSLSSLETDGEPSFHVVLGNVIVESGPDETDLAKALERIAGFTVMGNVLCPDSLAGLVEAKIHQQMGSLITYPDDATVITGSLDLNAGFLHEIDAPSKFVVVGSVRALEDVSDAILQKIESLQVRGRVICSESNVDAIRSKLSAGKAGFIVVPTGFRFHEGTLELDAAAVGSLEDAKLFCTGKVVLATDVDPSSIERGIAGLRSLGLIVCPEGLKAALTPKLDLVEDRAIFYEGELWLFDEEHQLHASRFEYSEGKATALVVGELTIEPDVAPDVIANRFHAIHNLGEIRCTPEQMGAIEARLGIHEGDLLDSTPKEKEKYDIGNANVLAL